MAYFKPLPPLERLNELFVLDESSPSGVRWKVNRRRARAGDVAGSLHKSGYWRVKINRSLYALHRIVYYMQSGADPAGLTVDHPDRSRANNNQLLRLADWSQNNANTAKRSNCSSTYKGVRKVAPSDRNWCKWNASIKRDGVSINLGYFEDEKEAAQAYDRAAIEMFGRYACTNF